jgi:kynureninase
MLMMYWLHFKQHFHFPQKNGRDVIYFCGNSLGLQPKNVEAAIQDELSTWKEDRHWRLFWREKSMALYYQDYMKSSLVKDRGLQGRRSNGDELA